MLVLPAELTHVQAQTCLNVLLQAAEAEAAPQVLVDASALTRFDSSALAVLLECRRAALARGLTLALDRLPAGLHSMAQLYGVLPLLVAPTATNEPA